MPLKPFFISALVILTLQKSFAQEASKNTFMFEPTLRFERYQSLPIPFAALDLKYGSVGKNFSAGMSLSGYTSTSSIGIMDTSINNLIYVSPYGYRANAFLRATSHSQNGHIYGELTGGFGQMIISGKQSDIIIKGKLLEYSGGVNIGYNFKIVDGSFFNLHIGASTGKLQTMTGINSEEIFYRFNVGFGFQRQFDVGATD